MPGNHDNQTLEASRIAFGRADGAGCEGRSLNATVPSRVRHRRRGSVSYPTTDIVTRVDSDFPAGIMGLQVAEHSRDA